MMDVEIRNYKHEDFPELVLLLNDVYNSEIDKNTLENTYITDQHSIIVASVENQIVGCSFIEMKEDFVRPNRIIYVTYVAIKQEYRKHGIGRMIMAEIEQICKNLNCSAIELTSANYRTGAHAFYESLGYTKKKTTVFIKEVQE